MMHRRVSHSSDVAETVKSSRTPTKLSRRRRAHPRRSFSTEYLQLMVKQGLIIIGAISVVCLGLTATSKLWSSSWSLGGTPARKLNEIKPNSGAVIEDLEVLPWNPIYRVADAMEQVGDRSGHYARLRKDTDAYLADDPARTDQHFREVWQGQRSYQARPIEVRNSDQVAYDIYNCPENPPAGYPFAWKTIDILKAWPTDDTHPPEGPDQSGLIHQALCVFDYTKDYQKAITYRDASLPFVVVNDPNVAKTVVRWSLPEYMDWLLGTVPHRTEYSENNHFMYYVPPPKQQGRRRVRSGREGHGDHHPRLQVPEGWKEPTKMMRMSYQEWLKHANVSDTHTTRDDPHWYFRLIGCGAMGNDGSCDFGSSEYLFDELPYFQPKPSLYIVEPSEQKGIHCRFGMRGVIAENHFDGSRNAIALLKGSRRYILSHPDQCSNLALHPKGHPSARHSAVDWSNPDLEQYPEFAKAKSSEVVLQPGQVLYLPTNWFHYIVSLELNYQCNTRSGIEQNLMPYVQACGF